MDTSQSEPVTNPPSSPSSAGMLNGAYGTRFEGGNIINFSGTSNSINQESGVGVHTVLVSSLFLLVVLFYRLL